MRLFTYILSENFKFKNAKDQDYPVKNAGVVFFSKDDTYKLRGKAHNLASHGIKHLKDLKPNKYKSIIDTVLNYIKDTDYILQGNKLDFDVVINTLDRINDKIHFKEQLTEEEKNISKYIEEIENIYRSMCSNFIRKAESPEKLKDDVNIFSIDKPIKFSVLQVGNDKPSTHYLNFNNLWFAVERNNSVRSFYPLDDKQEILRKYKKNKILSDKLNKLLYG